MSDLNLPEIFSDLEINFKQLTTLLVEELDSE